MDENPRQSRLEKLLEPKETKPNGLRQRFPTIYSVFSELKTSSNKILKFVFSAVALGVFDASGGANALHFTQAGAAIQNYLPAEFQAYFPFFGARFLYQTTLVALDCGLAMWSLQDNRWRKKRNLMNASMTAPHAACMDYTSAAIMAGRIDVLPLPKTDYSWRIETYAHTPLGWFARWVDEPSRLIPGAIQGYDLAIYVTIGYVCAQALISGYKYFKLKRLSANDCSQALEYG